MRFKTIDIDLDAQDRDGVAAAQQLVGAGNLTLNGALGTTLDYARIIGIYSAGNLSGVNFTITGTNANGQSISESVVGPNNSTVVSTKLYKTITSVAADAAVGSNVEVGTVATTLSAESKVIPINSKCGVGATVHVDVTGTINFTVKETFMNPEQSSTNNISWIDISALASKTADTVSQCTPHASAVKIVINSYSSGAELQAYISTGNSENG